MLEIFTITDLRHAATMIWTCAEPESRLCWMKLWSSDNHYITVPHIYYTTVHVFISLPSVITVNISVYKQYILYITNWTSNAYSGLRSRILAIVLKPYPASAYHNCDAKIKESEWKNTWKRSEREVIGKIFFAKKLQCRCLIGSVINMPLPKHLHPKFTRR